VKASFFQYAIIDGKLKYDTDIPEGSFMKFQIVGSGGCVSLPKPLCQCRVCTEARRKGYPYARCGCSLYLEDANLLVDTPEDICHALNNSDIRAVDTVLYSHWDPDHTLGLRVMEQLRLEWLDYSVGKMCGNPVGIYALPQVMEDLNRIRNPSGSYFDYYEHMHLISRHEVSDVSISGIHITFVPVSSGKAVSTFIFEHAGRKLIYAPCDCKPFPDSLLFERADVLVIGNTFVGPTLKEGRVMAADNPLRQELFSMDEVLAVREKYGIGRVVITHLEEDWGKSFADYRELEKEYSGVEFAYDGKVVEL